MAARARVWRRRFSAESGRFSRESPGSPENTSCVFSVAYVRRCVMVALQSAYTSLQSTYSNPGRAMAVGGPSRRRSGRKAFGAMWPPGIMSTRGSATVAGARAVTAHSDPPTSSLPTLPRLKPERALSWFLPARNTTTVKLDRHGAALERRVPRALAGTLPGPSCGFVAGVRERNEAMPGGADTGRDTHSTVAVGGGADVPDIPEVASEQSGAAKPRQHARHALVGVEVQDVFEDDTGVAET